MQSIKRIALVLFLLIILVNTAFCQLLTRGEIIKNAELLLEDLNKLSHQNQELDLSFAPYYSGIHPSVLRSKERILIDGIPADGWGKILYFNNCFFPLGTSQPGNLPHLINTNAEVDLMAAEVRVLRLNQTGKREFVYLKDLILRRLNELSNGQRISIYRGTKAEKELHAWLNKDIKQLNVKTYFTPSPVYAGRYANPLKLIKKEGFIIKLSLSLEKLIAGIKSNDILVALELPGSTEFSICGPIDSFTSTRYYGDDFFGAEIELRPVTSAGRDILLSGQIETLLLDNYIGLRKEHIRKRWAQLAKELEIARSHGVKTLEIDCGDELKRELNEFNNEFIAWKAIANEKPTITELIQAAQKLSKTQNFVFAKLADKFAEVLGNDLIELGNFARLYPDKVRGHLLYHYTDDYLAEKIREEGFKASSTGLQGSAVYMASDPYSSITYGSSVVIVKLKPEAKILDIQNRTELLKSMPGSTPKEHGRFQEQKGEIIVNLLDVPLVKFPNRLDADTWFAVKNLNCIAKIYTLAETVEHFKRLEKDPEVSFNQSYILKGIIERLTGKRNFEYDKIKKMLNKLDSSDSKIREEAAQIFGRGNYELLRYCLLARYFTLQTKERFNYLIGLQTLDNSHKSLPWVYRALELSQTHIDKLIAIKTIGRIGDRDSLNFLKNYLEKNKFSLSKKLQDEIYENSDLILRRIE